MDIYFGVKWVGLCPLTPCSVIVKTITHIFIASPLPHPSRIEESSFKFPH